MKGLLIKDFKLLKQQIRFFILIILIAFLYTLTSNNYIFVTSYVSFVCSMFVTTTISYDEFDNGNAFLFTLPISRASYVKEKYLFGLMTSGSAWLFSFITMTLYLMIKTPHFIIEDWILSQVMILPLLLMLLSLMIPVHLKYGSEKGRFALIGVVGAIFIFGFIFTLVLKQLNIDIIDMLNTLSNLNIGWMIAIITIISFAIFIFSIKISEKIIDKKEF